MNVFVDTNVLAYWVLINGMLKWKKERKRKEILEKYKKLKQAYDFIEYVIREKSMDFSISTSKLALAELIMVLNDFIISKKMHLDGIATIYWPKYKKDFLLNDEEFDEFQDDLIKKINFLRSSKFKIVDDEILELQNYPYFVAQLGLLTQDAILLNTALLNVNANYLVTMDRDFLELNKKEDVKKFFDKKGMRIIMPQEMLSIMKKDRNAR